MMATDIQKSNRVKLCGYGRFLICQEDRWHCETSHHSGPGLNWNRATWYYRHQHGDLVPCLHQDKEDKYVVLKPTITMKH